MEELNRVLIPGNMCPICKAPVYKTPSGVACENGHGGIEEVPCEPDVSPKVIGVIGSRKRNSTRDRLIVFKTLDRIMNEGDWLCSGGCPQGGDYFAEEYAKKNGKAILIFYPDYSRYGRGAPFKRNASIAANSDMIVACVVNPQDGIEAVLKRKSGGTENTLKSFCKREHKDKVLLV